LGSFGGVLERLGISLTVYHRNAQSLPAAWVKLTHYQA